MLALSTLHSTGEPFRGTTIQATYNERPLETFQDLASRAEAVYQQTHALSEAVAHLIADSASPPLAASGVHRLVERAAAHGHPLEAEFRTRRRELQILQWLVTVRNKAVQHRAQNGYTDNKAIVLSDSFVLCRAPVPPEPSVVRKARAALTGLVNAFNIQLELSTGSHEIIAYLDLVSHSLLRSHPGRADPARRIVEEARVHYVVVSSPVLQNIMWAIRRLLEIVPEHPGAVASGSR